MVHTARLSAYVLAMSMLAAAPTLAQAVGSEEAVLGQKPADSNPEDRRARPIARTGSKADGVTGTFTVEIRDSDLWRSIGAADRLLLFFVPAAGVPSRGGKAILCSDLRVCGRRPCDAREGAGCDASLEGGERG
jgi:hypothetical protein